MNETLTFRFPRQTQEAEVPASSLQSVITSSELIANLTRPLTEKQLSEIEGLIEAEGRKLVSDYHTECDEKARISGTRVNSIRERLNGLRTALSQAQEEVRSKVHGSFHKAVIYLFFGVVCLLAEFALTLYTLPFVLDIPPFSILGLAIAAAPSSALLVLDIAFSRLLENPWRSWNRRLSTGRWKRTLVGIGMAVFLGSLAYANLLMVNYLAEVREEASIARQNLSVDGAPQAFLGMPGQGTDAQALRENPELGSDPSGTGSSGGYDIDHGHLSRTVVAVSLLVAVDGALLILLGLHEVHAINRRRRPASRAKRLQKQVKEAERNLEAAESESIQCQANQAAAATAAEAIAECYCKRRLIDLHSTQARNLAEQSAGSLIDGSLLRDWHIQPIASESRT